MTTLSFDTLAEVTKIYEGSDGDATKGLYERLQRLGPKGCLALNLFRAQKNSERAKAYRGSGYRGAAYDRKQWAMDNLCTILAAQAEALGVRWGWGKDETAIGYEAVLYVDLPRLDGLIHGTQVSFHTARRGEGPDYPGDWDGAKGKSPERIIRFCAAVLVEGERSGKASAA